MASKVARLCLKNHFTAGQNLGLRGHAKELPWSNDLELLYPWDRVEACAFERSPSL